MNLRKSIVSFYIGVFGNKLSPQINLINLIYLIFAKFIFRLRNPFFNSPQESKQIAANGYLIQNNLDQKGIIDTISEKIDKLYKNEENLDLTYEDSGLIHLKNSLIHFPELVNILNDKGVNDIVSGFLGTYFQIFSSNIYRTTKSNPEQNSFSSLYYHFDSMPSSHLKLMIYLQDIDEKKGALKVVNRKKSIEIRSEGFWDRKTTKFNEIIKNNSLTLEGKKGTLIYFYPHDTIHKATLPEKGYRDIVNFILIPSFKPQYEIEKGRRQFLSNNFEGFCKNPFKF